MKQNRWFCLSHDCSPLRYYNQTLKERQNLLESRGLDPTRV